MSTTPRQTTMARPAYHRPPLLREKPQRGFVGYYRSAEGEQPGNGGHVPRSVEEAAVQAVRLAYQVADEQISRSARLAKRLKRAGDAEVGADSELQALDAMERLTLKLMMAALSWAEATAAGPGSPLKRMASAQYRALGAIFGLAEEGGPAAPARSQEGPPTRARSDTSAPAQKLRVIYESRERRALRDLRVSLPRLPAERYEALFYSATQRGDPPLDAHLLVDEQGMPTLHLHTRADCAPGWWSAAICDAQGLFLGSVEIEL